MRPRPGKRALLVSLAVVMLGGLAFAVTALSAPTKPGLTVQMSPASQSVQRGQSAKYTLSVTSTGGFAGTASLAASGLPSGSSAAFSPASVTLGSGATGTATMSVATSGATSVGSSSFTVTATNGKVHGSVSGGLTVNYTLSGSLAMTVTPSSVTMSAGARAVYSVQLARKNLSGPVRLCLVGALPRGATTSFSPNPTTANASTLQVTTTTAVAEGTYQLYLVASGVDANNARRYAYAEVQLVISRGGKPFSISGNLADPLAPGLSKPLNLTISNPNNSALAVTNLTVTVQSVTKRSGETRPCTTADYAIAQYSGPYPLSVAKNAGASLSGLGVASTNWPQVRMLDTASNQDGCKGAVLTLAYSGSGSGS